MEEYRYLYLLCYLLYGTKPCVQFALFAIGSQHPTSSTLHPLAKTTAVLSYIPPVHILWHLFAKVRLSIKALVAYIFVRYVYTNRATQHPLTSFNSVVCTILWFRIVLHISVPLLISVTLSDSMCLLLVAALRSTSSKGDKSGPVIDDELRDKLIKNASSPICSPTRPGHASATVRNSHYIQPLDDTAATMAEVQKRVNDFATGPHSTVGHSDVHPNKTEDPFAGAIGQLDKEDSLAHGTITMARAHLPGGNSNWTRMYPRALGMATIIEHPPDNLHPSDRGSAAFSQNGGPQPPPSSTFVQHGHPWQRNGRSSGESKFNRV
jgi:hypothetical protein